ncbi:MAG: hypothetical protein D6722_10610 [Bacteroidetes bacterium]|nr:MAG: hypothetical protein D6722_10610 [Bacteroidota bacterium]
MKQSIPLFAALLLSLFVTACSTTRYSSTDLELEAQVHREIAILPPQISYAGPLPDHLTQAEIRAIDQGESRMYHRALYDALLRKSNSRVKVKVQPVERTLARLHDQQISLHESWRMDPAELAEALGVDAVVKMHVEEVRYMSDAMAFGLNVGQSVVRQAYRHHPYGAPWPAYAPVRSADLRISCAIFSAQQGDLIWQMAVDRSATWHNPAEQVVATVSRKIARNFPYR